jgi:hypothetical protein
MAASKPKDSAPVKDAPTNHQGLVANQETSIRDATHPDEKPDPSTVAQVEVVKS